MIFICREYVILCAEFEQITCTSRHELIRYEKIRRKWGTKFLYRICIRENGDFMENRKWKLKIYQVN